LGVLAVAERPPFLLSDYNLISLSRHTGLVALFPFLAMKTAAVKTCNCHGGQKIDRRILLTETGRIKAAILGMPQADFLRFKQALHQDKIRILFPDGTTRDRV
jgi:hypothetical protein